MEEINEPSEYERRNVSPYPEIMRTLRIIVDATESTVCIDVVLRGETNDVVEVEDEIVALIKREQEPVWVDKGTQRDTVAFDVEPTIQICPTCDAGDPTSIIPLSGCECAQV